MSISKVCLPIFLFGFYCIQTAHSQPHPLNQFGRDVFNSFRDRDLTKFIENSVFSLEEDDFRNFLREIKNDALISQLREGSKEDWSIAFAKNWRKHWRHVAKHQKNQIGAQSFYPILSSAKEDGIQWQTTTLTKIEVLLPVTLVQKHFEVKRDTYTTNAKSPDSNQTNKPDSDSSTLYFDRGISYRLRMDSSTHGYGFMVGKKPEDSKNRFDRGIQRNGKAVGDILMKFEESPSLLYYFCPDRKGVGGSILLKDANDLDKPNQRIDLLLTFDFGQPKRSYQILVREILSTPRGPLFFEKPKWLGEAEVSVGTD